MVLDQALGAVLAKRELEGKVASKELKAEMEAVNTELARLKAAVARDPLPNLERVSALLREHTAR